MGFELPKEAQPEMMLEATTFVFFGLKMSHVVKPNAAAPKFWMVGTNLFLVKLGIASY
jgi:hypothetical protein